MVRPSAAVMKSADQRGKASPSCFFLKDQRLSLRVGH
jgi:hypothetical protein